MTDQDKAVELLARGLFDFAVDALASYDVATADCHTDPELHEVCRVSAVYLSAQIAPLTAVKVKPLVWEDFHDRAARASGFYDARYVIQFWHHRGEWEVSLSYPGYGTGYDGLRWHHTLEAAKAAAQADYQARILAAVEAVPIAQTVAAERAACTEELRLAVAAARAEERELAAKVAEGCPDSHWAWWVADAIRARSEGGEG